MNPKINDLLSKLRASGIIKSLEDVSRKKLEENKRIEEVFSGNWVFNQAGNVFIIEEELRYGSFHGKIGVFDNIYPSEIFQLENIDTESSLTIKDIIFLDIETSSLSFGAGSFVFLVGLCFFSEEGLKTKLFFIDTPANEPALLSKIEDELEGFSIISSYNGKSFDLPFLRNRAKFHQLSLDFEKKHHIDLLFLARRLWKTRLDSCKLSEIEREILAVNRDSSEIPGWLIPQIYFDYLSQKDPTLLEGVFYHNKIDVISLATLFIYISELIQFSGKKKIHDSRDYFSLALMYDKKKDFESANIFYKMGFHSFKKSEISPDHFRRYGLMHKKYGNFQEAVKNWHIAARRGDIIACIELAKYYEHKEKEFNYAFKWAKAAKDYLISCEKYNKAQLLLEEIDYRIDRIIRKISNDEKQVS